MFHSNDRKKKSVSNCVNDPMRRPHHNPLTSYTFGATSGIRSSSSSVAVAAAAGARSTLRDLRPRQPSSAFILFRTDVHRQFVEEEDQQPGVQRDRGTISREASRRWRGCGCASYVGTHAHARTRRRGDGA